MTTEPPPDLRARTLRAALSRRPPARPAPGFARPYAALVAMLDALLGGLDDAEWEARAAGDWDARDLVVHLAATDGLLGEAIAGGGSSLADVLARTEDAIGRRPAPAAARRTWRRQADALCDRLAKADADRRVEVGGFPMRLRHHLTARAAETWIHADDIARATGRDLPPPPAEHLHPIADLSARSLPRALAVTGRAHPDRLLHLVLDGPGGGRWTLPLSRDTAHDAPSAQVRMDVVEFCFLAGGRRTPADVRAETSGDPAVARDVLAAASVFSGP
ncbi:maleylpyruvate isomerase family mycothiol-dependent enzyme [Actinomadura chibensis]|uniref:Maleylpyruvate isomerase family mycothiol-dependent enzyme n=1 Tax=Actinomadura chibensis TaxID=392828 RepID=A0A5D0NNY3_9ACTN|nr:maleylpyruvate isomerase family mycothiol-dependent enzyme [Actinomadura chibensis]TYB46273.1 maleylpyruvate isomerase family mycothiol-dependent enzyme [Actinomadura chibensis]